MHSVYNYLNYREFIEDFYNEQKSINKAFSFQYFANKAGFKSKSFIKLVIDGKKNLSEDSMKRINNVLKLNEKAFSYFCDLVAFNQASSLAEQNFFFEKLTQYNKRSNVRTVRSQQYEIYSRWYFNAVRELVVAVPFNEDYELLGKMLKPVISARKASEAVELLLKLGFIKKEDSRYIQCDPLITTGDEVRSLAITNFHLENLALAATAIETVPAGGRDISCVVAGLSDEGFCRVKEEIRKFRKKILEIASLDKTIDRVYHISFQSFPVSEVINEKNT